MKSSQQIKQDFDRDGYVALPGFLSAGETAQLQAEVDRYVEQVVPTLERTEAIYEDRGRPETLKHLTNLAAHDECFARLVRDERFLELGRLLLDDELVSQDTQWFDKPPQTGLATPAHQDGYYFMLEPNEALTMWLALDDVDEANGCVRYIPGSHREPMRPHGRTDTLGFSQGITDYGDSDRAREIPVPARPGDLLVHHSMTVHAAGANTTTDRHRRALGLVYYAQRARKDEKRSEEYARKLQADLAAKGRL